MAIVSKRWFYAVWVVLIGIFAVMHALNLADRLMVGADGENRNRGTLAQLRKIICVVVQNNPANIRGDGGTSHLRKCGSARRLENDCIGTQRRRSLDEVQQLLALRDRIVAGMNDLDVYVQPPGSLKRR